MHKRRIKKSPISFGVGFILVIILFASQKNVGLQSQVPRRVISLAPNLTEMIYRLGVEKYLVGRTSYCNYPPTVKQLPSVGGYLDPDYETMVSLQPEVVFMLKGAYYRNHFQQLGIPTVEFSAETIEDILLSLQKMGEIFQIQRRAVDVVRQIRDTLKMVEKNVRPTSPTALIMIGHEPGVLRGLYVVSNGSFIGQLWRKAGGRNVFPQEEPHFFETSLENVLAANPEIIIDLHGSSLTNVQKQQCQQLWQAFPQITAVKKRHIFVLDQPGVLIPGPRITRTAWLFHQLIQQVEHTAMKE